MIPDQQLRELANHHSCPRCGDQLSARESAGPVRFQAQRDAETSSRKPLCKRFVEDFLMCWKPAIAAAIVGPTTILAPVGKCWLFRKRLHVGTRPPATLV